jgi:HPt (histidine-containing phosphotransfer) domain-containing protein
MTLIANTESLKGIVGEEGFVRIANAFLQESSLVVVQLEKQLNTGSVAEVRQTAHKLKGMCSSVTATTVASLSNRIQQAAMQDNLAEASAAFKELKPAFNELVSYLQESINSEKDCCD